MLHIFKHLNYMVLTYEFPHKAPQEALNMCWKLCWFNYRPTFGASINALLLATRTHTALTKMNRLQSIQKKYETHYLLLGQGQSLGYVLLLAASLAGNFCCCHYVVL